ncbi:MAG: hypothetical protein IJ960_03035 [Oscillospiraceae bacterium]|nr:hypothetical protein [Oscillospiraceae bacterium]
MKNTLRFDHDARCIVMDRTFYKNSFNIRFEEYAMLQRARQDYPTYTPVIKRIKRNPNMETYKGLTYAYMERYIEGHDNAKANMAEYRELRLISECHCKARRYPKVKQWFLKKYPEVEKFEIEESDNRATTKISDRYEAVMAPLIREDTEDDEYPLAG